ncbi:NAD(P)-dependent oxidoreductase [Actinomadura alba]|uniref:SDR family oxidoreductase n=1 Tax=Actinomadura alba TaxID=406431 RepID=A0ABR7LNZ1_9ACTN|nr:SDR family oxidoreductase [Actinomadura alba]MBC6466568.1 SDR family oxidoreductase [Actinomadura alba]
MRLAIFGGTGQVGRQLVQQALDRKHKVTALVRDPARAPVHDRLRIVQGDVRDARAVQKTLTGSDAVLSALGQRRLRGVTVCTDGMRAILPAMQTHGVTRLLAVSGYGVADSRHHGVYVTSLWLMIRSIMRDKERMEELIKGSDTRWTIIRPAVLTSGPRTGGYRTGTGLHLAYGSKVSHADVADFMLSQLTCDDHVHQAVAIRS